MKSTPAQALQPVHKKLHIAIILTLVSIFVIAPLAFGAAAVALFPSTRLCSGLVRTGNEVSALFESKLELATYNYHCLGSTPPTTKNQSISLGLLSKATYESRATFQSAITDELQSGSWSVVQTASGSTTAQDLVTYSKDGYTATITIHSYQPAYATVKITPDAPRANMGFVFEKAPNAPPNLTPEQKVRFVSVPIYTPEHIPAGYSAWVTNTKQTSGETAVVTLQGGQGSVSPRLKTTPATPGYDITVGRELLATTSNGVNIYIATSASTQRRYDALAIVGAYLVIFESSYQHPNVDPQPTVDDITQVFEVLKYTNALAK